MWFLIISIIVISVVGTISHFSYDISRHNRVVGLFSAVNESTWEHIKIALTPTLSWSLIDGYIFGMNANYFFAKFTSLFVIIVLMPSLYYGHKAIIKKELFVLDIISFYIVIIVSQCTFHLLLNVNNTPHIIRYLSCLGTFILFGGYMIHTLMPAKSFLFKDPLTNKYGYKGHSEEFNIMKNKSEKN